MHVRIFYVLLGGVIVFHCSDSMLVSVNIIIVTVLVVGSILECINDIVVFHIFQHAAVHARQMDDLSKEIHKLDMKIRHLEHAKQGAAIHNEMPTGERAIPAPTEAREEESNNNEHSSTAVVYYRPPIGRFGPRVEHRPLADE